jgi:hypothetical protein
MLGLLRNVTTHTPLHDHRQPIIRRFDQLSSLAPHSICHTHPLQVRQILSKHECQPSLLHGDLWTGNVGATDDNEPVIFVSRQSVDRPVGRSVGW